MRALFLAAFTLGLLATAYVPAASADALCLPGVPEQRPACVAVDRCRTHHTEGLCAGAVTPAGGLRSTCQHDAFRAGFCHTGAGAAGHDAGAKVGCARHEGLGCHAGAGAEGVGAVGAHGHLGRGGACAGAGSRVLGQGVAECLRLPHV